MKKQKENYKKIELFSIIVFVLTPVLIFFIILNNVSEGPFSTVHSISTTNITQEIKSINPIEKSDVLTAFEHIYNSTSDYVVKYPLEISDEIENSELQSVNSPVSTFVGQVTFPYATVILSIDYDAYFVTVVSDSHGYWSWTNYGQPFTSGEHILTVYSIDINESDTKDVLVNQYKFLIQGSENQYPPPELKFTDDNRSGQEINDSLIQYFGSEEPEPYVFLEEIKGGINEYAVGSVLEILMFLYPLKEAEVEEVIFNYDLFSTDITQSDPILSFNEQINTESSGYSKKFHLSKRAPKGNYILKTEALIGGHKYIQNVSFEVVDNISISVTGDTINEENKPQAIIWNIVFSLFILLIVLIVVISEFRHFLISQPIDEDTLHKHGFFK